MLATTESSEPFFADERSVSAPPADGLIEMSEVKASQKFSVAQLKAFVAAAESGSISKAAERLGLSQPTLSRSIRDMEIALGYGLFQRSRSGVGLSRAGQAILPKARNLVATYASTLAFVAERRASRRLSLRLAADASIAPVIHDKLSATLAKHSPAIKLQLAAMGSEEAVNQVLDYSADLALCGDMEGNPSLRYTPVLAAQLGLIVPQGCAVPENLQSLDEVADASFIRLADCTPVTRTLRRSKVPFAAYFDSPIVYTCLSAAFDSMREKNIIAVATGIGASLPQARGMRFVPLPGLLPSLNVYLVSSRSVEPDGHSERLRDLVRHGVHESPWHPSVRRLNRLTHGFFDEDAGG
ncbi:MAG: LysR family transcriptional regulator [Ramlibacter sp.]|nr:LysR family transcriptional regulator [Ramlibacter sp.]